MPEDNTVHSWIYSWHMRHFYLNGMLLSYTSYVRKPLLCVEGVIFQGIKKLIIPYYSYGCLLMVVRWWNSGFDVANLKWQISWFGIFLGNWCYLVFTMFVLCATYLLGIKETFFSNNISKLYDKSFIYVLNYNSNYDYSF